ncbi:MAG TPA: 4-(cytidine 5'-diphospho)-2-C-methyl-D-erythritol kinase [Vulgatibacter sp.]|nr:4-(cytidine 5'-diphospho)-2-C-methyl-D-erythritol kinase [Vulgatibacter sp.]
MVRAYEILAPAKVNLTLRILGRRPDGYHDLSTLMIPVSLADRLEVRVRGGAGATVRVPGHPELEGEENLCAAAAAAFEAELGIPGGVDVRLEKRVPVAGGLGGGSSDAAAVLRCLAAANDVAPDDPRLVAAALRVGSDVPFFVHGRPAVARGRGERLSPSPLLPEELHLVVLRPAFGVSAGDAYRSLAALRDAGILPPGEDVPLPPALPDAGAVAAVLHNDLEAAVAAIAPIREPMARLASGGHPVLLSGSGSCAFALCATREEALELARSVRSASDETIHVARALRQAPDPREIEV